MNLPTTEQCNHYFIQYAVPPNIFLHCLKVRDVALFLGFKLSPCKLNLNLDFVRAIALLHDLFKVVVFKELKPDPQFHPKPYTSLEVAMWKKLRTQYPGLFESEVAYEVFKDEFPELALAIKRSCDPIQKDKTWEELLVHYADWIVMQEKIVTLNERLSYFLSQYPCSREYRQEYEKLIKEYEKKLFFHLPFKPEDLALVFEREGKNYD